jgi:hypothetical protein
MEHLSSCYFCGAAVETEVREYPVVTGSLDGVDLPPVDERPTVALCVPCRRKLDRVLAAGVGDADALGDGPPGSADGDAPGAVEDDAPGAPDRGDAGTADGPADDGAESGGPAPADATADLAVSGDEADEGPSIAADAEIFGDVDPVYPDEDGLEAASGGVGDPEGGGGPTGGDDPDPDGDAGGPAPDREDRSFSTSQAAGGRATSSHGESESEGTTPDGSDGGGGDDGSDDGGADGPEVPREAYNKVVRLLQNREFPVQRGDVLAVATNAYDLRRRDCEAAIDALVERGIVDAEGDRLLRPDD